MSVSFALNVLMAHNAFSTRLFNNLMQVIESFSTLSTLQALHFYKFTDSAETINHKSTKAI